MAITSKIVTVGDVEYTVQAFAASKGLRIFQKLAKVIGPAFKSLANASDEGEAASVAISSLLSSLDDVELDVLMKDLLSGVYRNGTAINFETEFMANAGVMVKLAQEVVNLNWGSLFTMLGTVEE